MRRIALVSLSLLAVAAFCAATVSSAREKSGDKVGIKLGAMPKVKTGATGEATFVLSKDGAVLHYEVHVDKLENVTMAHVHEVGAGGSPGPVLAWLYPVTGETPSLKKGNTSGTLATGNLRADKLSGPAKGKAPKDVFEMLKAGKAGVAVHTEQNPAGELWGVITHK